MFRNSKKKSTNHLQKISLLVLPDRELPIDQAWIGHSGAFQLNLTSFQKINIKPLRSSTSPEAINNISIQTYCSTNNNSIKSNEFLTYFLSFLQKFEKTKISYIPFFQGSLLPFKSQEEVQYCRFIFNMENSKTSPSSLDFSPLVDSVLGGNVFTDSTDQNYNNTDKKTSSNDSIEKCLQMQQLYSLYLPTSTGILSQILSIIKSQNEFQNKLNDFLQSFSFVKNTIGFEKISGLDNLKSNLLLSIFPRTSQSSFLNKSEFHILIEGKRGSGKSKILQLVGNYFSSPDSRVHKSLLLYTKYIDCKLISTQQISAIYQQLSQEFDYAVERQPSLLLFDDLDTLIPNSSAESIPTVDPIRSLACSEILKTLLKRIQSHSVMTIITLQKKEKLHPSLLNPAFFQIQLQIPIPDKKNRKEIMKQLLPNELNEADLDEISKECEGFVAQDLEQISKRAFHNASLRFIKENKSDKGSVLIELADLLKARKGYIPLSLKSAPLVKTSIKWSDIGGLSKVKSQLKQIIEWPTKFAQLYKNCPLRSRTGILLYGPPGCGKTVVACSIASECNLNLIVVKGPELLNKYIGASEQAVREKFETAKAASPCVLFFDEFDSIAPRRGHDNTGVTDRVVNQFLTALDGVEALEGVYVLAATSRPDLIDPALLRPGRLDRSILLSLPTDEELVDILKKQSSKLNVDSSVNFEQLARRCHHFTPADTQSLLSNAQLESIHEFIDSQQQNYSRSFNSHENSSVHLIKNGSHSFDTKEQKIIFEKKMEITKSNILGESVSKNDKDLKTDTGPLIITQKHIDKAFGNFRSSLSIQDIKFYNDLYENFKTSDSIIKRDMKKRQTLA